MTGWTGTLAGKFGTALPAGTAYGRVELEDGRWRLWVRTGHLVTHVAVPTVRWGSPAVEHEACWRSWDLLFWRHWARLAHDRGGYC